MYQDGFSAAAIVHSAKMNKVLDEVRYGKQETSLMVKFKRVGGKQALGTMQMVFHRGQTR